MESPLKLEYSDLPVHYCIRCCGCKTRVAFVEDYVSLGPNIQEGLFIDAFNVRAPHYDIYHQVVGERTLVNAYCIQCGVLLERKIIAAFRQNRQYRVGRFLLNLDMLIYWNDVTLLQNYEEQVGGPNEQNADQDWGINERDVGANDQELGANEQNVVQDEDANLGANEQNVVQDEDANLGVNEENVVQDEDANLGANEQNVVQDEANLGANEQNVVQDEDANEQNDDEDGDARMN